MATALSDVPRNSLVILRGTLMALRPKQSTKNGLILFALFFTVNRWWNPEDVLGMLQIIGISLVALVLITMVSSALYLVNDVLDAEKDRAHPIKRSRPIAAGVVPVNLAWALAATLGMSGLVLSFLLRIEFGYTVMAYVLRMIAYNAFLKHMVILDVMSIAAGFVLRAVAGAVVLDHTVIGPAGRRIELDLAISPWLYISKALGALFIAIAKRRGELALAGDDSHRQRSILSEYSVRFLDQMIAIVAPATLIAYSFYTFSTGTIARHNLPDNNAMMLTIPFVAYGLFR
jgi:4-hydroxybenzoate polyprenyltransferase